MFVISCCVMHEGKVTGVSTREALKKRCSDFCWYI